MDISTEVPLDDGPESFCDDDNLPGMAQWTLSVHGALSWHGYDNSWASYSGASDDSFEDFLRELRSLELARSQKVRKAYTSYTRPRRARKVYGIDGYLHDESAVAVPDTGASINTINTAYALSRGMHIDSDSRHRNPIRTLRDTVVRPDGLIWLTWSFETDASHVYLLPFYAVRKTPHDVLLGMPFLNETATLSENSHRIKARDASNDYVVKRHKVCYQDTGSSPLPKISGSLDGKDAEALADTGCEVNIMSLTYARSHNLHIDKHPNSRELLEFGDGSTKKTVGKVYTSWRFPESEKEHLLCFDILESSILDLVLGQDIIFEAEVFKTHAEHVHYEAWSSDALRSLAENFLNAVRRVPRLLGKLKACLSGRSIRTGTDEQSRRRQEENEQLTEYAARKAAIDLMPDGPPKSRAKEQLEQQCQIWLQHQRQ